MHKTLSVNSNSYIGIASVTLTKRNQNILMFVGVDFSQNTKDVSVHTTKTL